MYYYCVCVMCGIHFELAAGLRLFFIRLSSIFCPIYSRIYSFHVSRRIFRDVQKRHSIWKSAFHWQCFSFQYQMTGAIRPHRTRECRGVELGEEIEMYDNSNRKHTKTTLGISLTTKNTASNGNSSNQCFFFFLKDHSHHIAKIAKKKFAFMRSKGII